ncbi:MAG: hypothetical protein VZR53_05605 [Prevotella sp.]|nr:hypothetical protein [Prevotella sp.]
MIKQYTDIKQSKILAEILPIESADMSYSIIHNVGQEPYHCNVPMFVPAMNGDIPCWSLSALLGILAEQDFMIKSSNTNNECLYNINIPSRHCKAWSPSLVDAVFEIIFWLKKGKQYESTYGY